MVVRKVKIFLGQSNCAGVGQPLYLLANHPGLLSLSSSHQIWNGNTQASETIAPGTNTNTTKYGIKNASHGIEVKFAADYVTATAETIYVFKHAVVGSLGNVRIGTPGMPIWNKAAAEIYPVMLAELAAFETAIKSGGDTITYVGLTWIQGESDVGAQNAIDYLKNLKTFIADLRVDLATPLLPIHVARLHNDFGGTNQIRANAIRAAQWQAVKDLADPNVTLIDTDSFTVNAGLVHFDDAGIQLFGAQAYTQTTLDNPGVGSAVIDATTQWLNDVGFPAAAGDGVRFPPG